MKRLNSKNPEWRRPRMNLKPLASAATVALCVYAVPALPQDTVV